MPLQSKRAGEVEYDYLLGIAALDAGDAQQTVFALERHTADALALLRSARAARPHSSEAHFLLGVALRRLNQLTDALAAFERALALEPGNLCLRPFRERRKRVPTQDSRRL